jgi:fructose/tagatose bisphosphate aldolase
MTIVNLNEVFKNAINDDYAIGAFNVHNLEFIEGVMRAAEEMSSPVIIGIATISIDYAGLEPLAALTRDYAERSQIPTVIHFQNADIDFRRLGEIHQAVDVPLVFHGCTGLKNEDYHKAIALGVKKFNVGTRSMVEFQKALGKAIGQDQNTLFSCLGAGTDAVVAAVKDRIKILKSDDKA